MSVSAAGQDQHLEFQAVGPVSMFFRVIAANRRTRMGQKKPNW
jgi:hypothetical protein